MRSSLSHKILHIATVKIKTRWSISRLKKNQWNYGENIHKENFSEFTFEAFLAWVQTNWSICSFSVLFRCLSSCPPKFKAIKHKCSSLIERVSMSFPGTPCRLECNYKDLSESLWSSFLNSRHLMEMVMFHIVQYARYVFWDEWACGTLCRFY